MGLVYERRAVWFGWVAGFGLFWAGCGAGVKSTPPPSASPGPGLVGQKKMIDYPPTREEDPKDTLFGVAVSDPFRWLEDAGSPEVKAWMTAQDRFARDALAKISARDILSARLRQLFYVDSISPPQHLGGRYFYTRTHADREKGILYWKEGRDGAEQVLLDPNTMSENGSISLGVAVPTYDGKRLAYALRKNNADEAILYVMDVKSGKVSEVDVIEGAKYAHPSWTPGGDGFYYTWLPTDPKIPITDRPGFAQIRFHRLGTDPRKDPVVREHTGNPQSFLGADLSRDGRWLFLYVQHGWNRTDVYFQDLRKEPRAGKAFLPFAVEKDAQYQVIPWKGRFYIFTNEGAPRWRVFRADSERPRREQWKEIVPERADTVIENADLLGGRLALRTLHLASNRLEVRDLDGALVRDISLPGIGAAGLSGEPQDDEAYYWYRSFTTPLAIYRTSMKATKDGGDALFAEVKLPIDASPYTVEQVFYPSKDGTKISMFLVHRKDLKKDGGTPFLLTGYGGFAVSSLPSFSASLFPWLEAGGGYALPNLRGGGEYGEEWHRAGMLKQKQNVFDDFLGAAEFLIKQGYTRPRRLAIRGGSNGGLLVGAALVQRPSLFRAVICAVPLLDMLRYHLQGSGKTWVPEYGSAEDEAGFQTLLAYSPYHHVKAGEAYPAVLMMSADSDDRVDPLHARKMAALLQRRSGSDHPVLLRIEKHSGHGGADMVKQAVEQGADAYAFLMSELGMQPVSSPAPALDR